MWSGEHDIVAERVEEDGDFEDPVGGSGILLN
jgi:hypothetical protein